MKIFMAIAVILGLGGSAGAGYYLLSRSAGAETGGEAEYVDPVRDPKFVTLDPLAVPVVVDGLIRRQVFLKLSLEVDGKAAAQRVLRQKQRLHNAFLMALYNGPIQPADDAGSLDIEKVKAVALAEARAVVGDDLVRAVRVREALPGGQ